LSYKRILFAQKLAACLLDDYDHLPPQNRWQGF